MGSVMMEGVVICQVVVAGDSGVGKTSLIARFLGEKFEQVSFMLYRLVSRASQARIGISFRVLFNLSLCIKRQKYWMRITRSFFRMVLQNKIQV